jgi:VWFA-related protein
MKTSLSLFLLASSLLSAQASLPTTSAAHPAELLVTAMGQDGKPIANLTKEEVGLLVDNAQPAAVGTIRRVSDEPLHLGIVLFASKAFFAREQAAATTLVQKLIRTNSDTAFVLTAGGSRPWSQPQINWQSDKDALTKTIQSLERNRGIADAFNFEIYDKDDEHQVNHYLAFGNGNQREWNMAQQRDHGPTIFDAVWEMMKTGPQDGRHVLVIFREPWAHATGGDSESFAYVDNQVAKIVATAQKLRIPIYAIGIEDPMLIPSESKSLGTEGRWTSYEEMIQRERQKLYFTGKTNIGRMSSETGGRTYWNSKKDYSDAVESIAGELQGEYSLTFVPPLVGPSTSAHAIKYVPNRLDLHIKGPTAYYLASPPGN